MKRSTYHCERHYHPDGKRRADALPWRETKGRIRHRNRRRVIERTGFDAALAREGEAS
jgi:hypothetical protein